MQAGGSSGPRARTAALHSEPVGDELLVYDLDRDVAHRLTAPVAAVLARCDGTRDAAALAAACGLPRAGVDRALAELEAADLLEDAPASLSRRELGVRLVKGAAVVAGAAPLIHSITAPTPAEAATICNSIVTNCRQCNPNCACTPIVVNVLYNCRTRT